jgi:very-short-patch-repair endonuclease
MRRQMTEPELMLWSQLRGAALEGLSFRRQTPIGPYIVDFFCPAKKLVVEVDGSQHLTDEGITADEARTRWLTAEGYVVLRFYNVEVIENIEGVLARIVEAAGLPPWFDGSV